jgi:hypothetical protein
MVWSIHDEFLKAASTLGPNVPGMRPHGLTLFHQPNSPFSPSLVSLCRDFQLAQALQAPLPKELFSCLLSLSQSLWESTYGPPSPEERLVMPGGVSWLYFPITAPAEKEIHSASVSRQGFVAGC